MFENSLALVDDCGITYLHVFPFSSRAGTPASRMPQVEATVVHDRARRLRLKGDTRLREFLSSEVGRTRKVLVENNGRGHTQHFAPVVFDRKATAGAVVDAVITAARPRHLEAHRTA
jgi:threonylcarbamoyladenosine tRNA methylthiotransferase MtaB